MAVVLPEAADGYGSLCHLMGAGVNDDVRAQRQRESARVREKERERDREERKRESLLIVVLGPPTDGLSIDIFVTFR